LRIVSIEISWKKLEACRYESLLSKLIDFQRKLDVYVFFYIHQNICRLNILVNILITVNDKERALQKS